MSRLKRDRAAKKLRDLLGLCPDGPFLDMCWALNMLFNGEPENAARYLRFPKEALANGYGAKHAVYPWEIETLVCERLLGPAFVRSDASLQRVVDCTSFQAAASIVTELRALEEAEAATYLKRFHILYEMHRIAQRQFPVQAGYFNKAQYYRFGFIYGGSQCAEYFQATYGISLNEFALIGFTLKSTFLKYARIGGFPDMSFLGIDRAAVERALRLLSAPIGEARDQHKADVAKVTQTWGFVPPVAYRPSYLRRRPLIGFVDDILYCPVPELIALRTTSGIYYDLVSGPAALRNEASKRFETYVAEFVGRTTDFEIGEEIEYRIGQRSFRTPDVLCSSGGIVSVALECKASKLTYDAQFAETPAASAKRGYDELAKGVVQLWRFVAHGRLGLLPVQLHKDLRCAVVTLDTWLSMSGNLKNEVVATAKAMALDDADIRDEDQRPVIFVSIHDLERTLLSGDDDSLVEAMDHAASESFAGWMLPDVLREKGLAREERAPYPFDARDVFPFFETVDRLARERGVSK